MQIYFAVEKRKYLGAPMRLVRENGGVDGSSAKRGAP